MYARGWIGSILALTVIAGPAGGCRQEVPRDGIGTRAVVIGIDGADWEVIDALAAHGKLPNLSRLRDRGASGPIATATDIALSPAIWTSVATGKTAVKHGISWFLIDQTDGTRAPVRSSNRRARAIWNILDQRGLESVVVGWWATYPAEDIDAGVIVSDALGFHGFGRTARGGDDGRKTHPPQLFAEVDALVPAEQQVSPEFVSRFVHIDAEDYRSEMYDPARYPRRDPRNPIQLLQQYVVTAQGYTAIAETLLARRSWDLFMVYFEQVDSLSHLFMKYAPPKLPWVGAVDFERYRDCVAEWYIYQDELLGRLLAQIDLGSTAVFVLSDHGFKSGSRRIHSEQTVDLRRAHLDHEDEGILVAAGPHLRSGVQLSGASVLDVTPTLLHYLGLPVARDMDGKVLEDLFEREFVQAHPIRYLASYEDPERAEAALVRTEGDQDLAEIVAGLEALGYVDSESEDSSPEIHNNLGHAHLRAGEVDAARAEFAKARALDQNDSGALLGLAGISRLEGNAAEAQRLVERALRANPNSVTALAELAEIHRDQGDLEESIRLYREALALDDSRPGIFLGLGDSLQRDGRYGDAVASFRRVLELEPDSFEAHYNLGVAFGGQHRPDQAIRQYETALRLAPRHPRIALVLNNLASEHLAQGNREDAVDRFEQAANISPYHFESRFNLANQYLRMGRLEEAVARLEEAAALRPNHEATLSMLAGAYLAQGRNQDAYRSFLLVRRLYPDNWTAALGLAALHAASDDPEGARPLLYDALERGGDSARAKAGTYPSLREFLASPGS